MAANGLIHVGAWEGIEYRGSVRKLMLFEPQAAPFAKLKSAFGGSPNVELHKLALGAKAQTVTMNTAHPDHSSSLLSCQQSTVNGITFSGQETVRMKTLDQVVDGRTGYGELRIDTQGYELEVLRGATETLRQIQRVECEVHDPNTYRDAASLEDIDSVLTSQGFVRVKLAQPGQDDLADVVYER